MKAGAYLVPRTDGEFDYTKSAVVLTAQQSPTHSVVALDQGVVVAVNWHPANLDPEDIERIWSLLPHPEPSSHDEENDDDEQSHGPMQIDFGEEQE